MSTADRIGMIDKNVKVGLNKKRLLFSIAQIIDKCLIADHTRIVLLSVIKKVDKRRDRKNLE